MQLFYADDISAKEEFYTLNEEESKHCVRVLRMGQGDRFEVTDGRGTLFTVEIADADSRRCRVKIVETTEEYEKRGYFLQMAVAPTKNVERYEWFVEKAAEIWVDVITPLLCERSERRHLKTDRLEKIAVSAIKQCLKAYLPKIDELTSFKEFVKRPFDGKKFIAHIEKDEKRVLLKDVLTGGERVLILIGPEGDFSPEEIRLAHENGFTGLSLGTSRLRTETAAVAAVHSVAFINEKGEEKAG